MVSVGIAGLGQMGSAALRILLEQLPDAQFLAMDRAPEAVRRAESLDPARVRGRVVDVTAESVDLDGVDVVLNLSGPFFAGSDGLAQAALRSGTTYIDIGDDLGRPKPSWPWMPTRRVPVSLSSAVPAGRPACPTGALPACSTNFPTATASRWCGQHTSVTPADWLRCATCSTWR